MLIKRNNVSPNVSPFNIMCKNFNEEIKPFTYQRFVDFGECYYYLKGTSFDYIATSVITRYKMKLTIHLVLDLIILMKLKRYILKN